MKKQLLLTAISLMLMGEANAKSWYVANGSDRSCELGAAHLFLDSPLNWERVTRANDIWVRTEVRRDEKGVFAVVVFGKMTDGTEVGMNFFPTLQLCQLFMKGVVKNIGTPDELR